jgi:hypothetical protein
VRRGRAQLHARPGEAGVDGTPALPPQGAVEVPRLGPWRERAAVVGAGHHAVAPVVERHQQVHLRGCGWYRASVETVIGCYLS